MSKSTEDAQTKQLIRTLEKAVTSAEKQAETMKGVVVMLRKLVADVKNLEKRVTALEKGAGRTKAK